MYTRRHKMGSQDNDFRISRAGNSLEGKAALRLIMMLDYHYEFGIVLPDFGFSLVDRNAVNITDIMAVL